MGSGCQVPALHSGHVGGWQEPLFGQADPQPGACPHTLHTLGCVRRRFQDSGICYFL